MSPLDDQIRAVLDRVRVTLSGQLETDLTASTADILRAAADEQQKAVRDAVERATADARREAESERDELLRSAADEQQKAVLDASERATAEARQEAEQQLSLVRVEFERDRDELRHVADSERAALEQTLLDVREELETARQGFSGAQSERETLVQELEQHRRAEERSAEEFRDAIQRGRYETEQMRLEADATARELEAVRARLAMASRLTSALRTLDEATSLGDILDRLAHSACQETGRAAVFLVNGEKLRGWRALGFAEGEPIVGSEMDRGDAGVVGEAVRSRVGQPFRNGDSTRLPAFAVTGSPRDAIALPVQVGGSVIAVLYADAARADRPEDPEWLEMIDTMAMHAGRVLEAMTVRHAAARWTTQPIGRAPSADRSPVGME